MGDEVFLIKRTPVVASTSLRHNTVEVWDKCASYTNNNRVVLFFCYNQFYYVPSMATLKH